MYVLRRRRREHYFENCSPKKTAALTRVACVGHELRSFFLHVLDTESISESRASLASRKTSVEDEQWSDAMTIERMARLTRSAR
jgi:hypothetical protein